MKRSFIGWMLAGGVTAGLVAGLVFIADQRAEAVPQNMNVTGYLQDGAGFPQSGEFPLRITFWSSTDAAGTPIGSHEQTVTIENGLFSLQVPVPEELLSLEAAYYSLAVDQERDGFDVGDEFNQRNPIGSVPYALQTKPREYFATGTMSIKGAGTTWVTSPGNKLYVSSFKSPPDGVEFDWIGIGVDYGSKPVTDPLSSEVSFPNNFNFGVYHSSGEPLFISNASTITRVNTYLSITPFKGRLDPASFYYIGWGCSGESPGFRITSMEPLPGFGVVNETVYNGQLPMKFNPLDINSDTPTVPFTLIFFKEGAFGDLPLKSAPDSAAGQNVQGGF